MKYILIAACLSALVSQAFSVSEKQLLITRAVVDHIVAEREKERVETIKRLSQEFKIWESLSPEEKASQDPFSPLGNSHQTCIAETKNKVYPPLCIRILDAAPSIDFIISLHRSKHPVLHPSLFQEWPTASDDENARAFRLHRRLGHINPPKLLSITKIEATEEKNIVVEFQIYCGPLHANGYRYHLKKTKDAWKVVEAEHTWVSQFRTRRSDQLRYGSASTT
jgi:hypothetical protein